MSQVTAVTERLLKILACPTCGGSLETAPGFVSCTTGHRFPVRGGIPRFQEGRHLDTDTDETRRSFGAEFTQLDPRTPSGRKRAEDRLTFFRATGLDPEVYRYLKNAAKRVDLTPSDIGYEPDASSVSGALVLDAGCGGGRFTMILSDLGAEVVALDISDAVERVAAECAGRAVHVVQGDVLEPPFGPGTFDHVFSIGVLHHTRDTRAGIAALTKLVRPGGTLSVWVYDPGYWAGPIRGPITRSLRRVLLRLPISARVAFCKEFLLPVGRLQLLLSRRRATKFLLAPLFVLNIPRHEDRDVMLSTIFDYWMAPVVRTHRAEELYDWFAELGFEDIQILPTPTAVRGRRPQAVHT